MASRVYGYQGFGDYQYDTTPRKLQPEYEPQSKIQVNRQSKTKQPQKAVIKKKAKAKNRAANKEEIRRKATFVAYIVFGFSLLFTIGYRDSVINERFNKKENLKSELAEIQKTNEQLEVSLENELNLTGVESVAKDELGMSKLNNNQKVYVKLPKKEYVESKVETISTYEKQTGLKKVVNDIVNVFE